LFSKAGTVDTVKVMRDMATGRARGFAFVEMSTDDEAQKAIQEFNAYQIGGRGRPSIGNDWRDRRGTFVLRKSRRGQHDQSEGR
jgi:hypothetical protein